MTYNPRSTSRKSSVGSSGFTFPSNYLFNSHNNNNNNTTPFSDPFDSDSSQSPPSTISYYSSAGSSLASSPSIQPANAFNLIPDDGFKLLSDPEQELAKAYANQLPTSSQLSHYASSVIRNEAYALLALAARLSPQGPIFTEVNSDNGSGSAAASEEGSSPIAAGPMAMEQDTVSISSGSGIGSPNSGSNAEEESRTNVAFRGVVDNLRNLPAHGKVLVTGVGKSGVVGKKMVATFNSLGIPSVFLHPLEALHGDLGVVCHCNPASPCDALLLISHSGATAELMRLIPVVRPRLRYLIAVTRDPDSVLSRACTGWLDAGTGAVAGIGGTGEKTTDEADCELPAPTSSVICGLAMGDALALCLSRLRVGWNSGGKERRKEFFKHHPGGQLGLQLGREDRQAPGFH